MKYTEILNIMDNAAYSPTPTAIHNVLNDCWTTIATAQLAEIPTLETMESISHVQVHLVIIKHIICIHKFSESVVSSSRLTLFLLFLLPP